MVIIKDPRLIPQVDDPLLVLCNQTGIISDIIDCRTHDAGVLPWDHAMLSINQGKFVCQNMRILNAYKEIPMESYMTKGTQLAFVTLVNSNPEFVKAFSKSVQNRLTSPWWQTQYDYLGILGQAIGQDWIHTPGLRYCSVDVIRHLVNSCPTLPKADQLIINNIPPESNPEKFWEVIINNPGTFNFFAEYDSTEGIVV